MQPLRRPTPPPTHLGIPPINPNSKGPSSLQKNDDIPFDTPRAGFGIRGLAFLIDVFAISGVSLIIIKAPHAPLIFKGMEENLVFITVQSICLVFLTILPTALYGRTVGKKILKLKVVRLNETQQLGFFRGFFRELIGKSVSSWFFFIGYLLALGPKKLTLHDRLFNTKVIRE